jgi:hypothetical protein
MFVLGFPTVAECSSTQDMFACIGGLFVVQLLGYFFCFS